MIANLQPNRVRRSYLGGGRIDAFCGLPQKPFNPSPLPPFNPPGAAQPRPEDWLASTTQAFNGTLEIEGEGLGRLEDGRLVRDVVGALPILVKLLDSDERLVVQAHPTVPCAERLFHSPVGKTECWYFLPGTALDACVYLGFKPGVTRSLWEGAVRGGMEAHAEFAEGAEGAVRRGMEAHAEFAEFAEGAVRRGMEAHAEFAEGAEGVVRRGMEAHAEFAEGAECAERGNAAERGGAAQDGKTSRLSRAASSSLLSLLHRVPVAPGDFVFVDGGVPHAIGGGCFMIELQEPSDLMVVAERFTPSGRRIPDAKMHGGIGWDRMFDVYEYDGLSYGETCGRYVRRCSQTSDDPVRICGPEFTDKFEMWRLKGGACVTLGGAPAVVVVTDGQGTLNGLPARRGDRLVVCGEASLAAAGSLSAIVCR